MELEKGRMYEHSVQSKYERPKMMRNRTMGMRAKKRAQLLMDILVSMICTAAVLICAVPFLEITLQGLLAVSMINVVQIIGFLVAFEEYSSSAVKWEEKVVCIFLSCLYSMILSFIENGIFFGSVWLLKIQLISFAVTLPALLAANRIFEGFARNVYWHKQRILVIIGENTDRQRLKRLKDGMMMDFDPSYESLDLENEVGTEALMNEKMQEYDAICIFDSLRDDVYERLVKSAMKLNKEVYAIPKAIDINRNRANYARFDDVLAYHIRRYELSDIELFVKRAFDLVTALICIVIAAFPMALIALAIKLTSPGPVIYKQIRLTQNKREFYIYKFRTMVQDAEKKSGPIFAQKHDPRITPVGRVLRSFRLDELPQLFNIIKGDMSIVGPRPERPFFVEQFESEIENYHYRFMVKAGLTSLSHVYGRYSTYIYDRTCYDLLYIANYSFLLDLKIILLTTKTMLLKDAAEGLEETDEFISA